MRKKIFLDDKWTWNCSWQEEFLEKSPGELTGEQVRIPHTVKETKLHYFDESEYQMLSGYRRIINADEEMVSSHVEITFEGVAHKAEVYINGEKVTESHCGYTAFTADLTGRLKVGENLLTVKVDSRESLNEPPFGYVIDYMTYGGIYRDVYMTITGEARIKDVFVITKLSPPSETEGALTSARSAVNPEITLSGAEPGDVIRLSICRKKDGEKYISLADYPLTCENKDITKEKITEETAEEITEGTAEKTAEKTTEKAADTNTNESADEKIIRLKAETGAVELWEPDNPAMYALKTQLIRSGAVIDECVTSFGFRKAVFHKNGFYLNGRKFKIRGLNRHQSYPYVGYAMPDSLQCTDADILKYKLGCNAVRTSHYPQSQGFIDHCDETGLLVFTEIPGWQHIGDEEWKNQAVENTRNMVRQYRNHPSIILWGVRINESVDDDEFYLRTNIAAMELDPTRQTGGVRCYKKGSLLEDVYTYNDFSHHGNNRGCEKKSAVTSNINKPYMITEYNGHMFPTKPGDTEEHRLEHALRHARVLNDVAGESDIAGSFGWCMFDYNTHKDFGSGDRICYHGVLDMFRNPKMAAWVYASQQEYEPVLEISSSFDIGEHPGGNRGDVYIFTNADSVLMYCGEHFIKEYKAKDSEFTELPHGPIKVDDYIGDALEKGEKMSHKEAEKIKSILNKAAGMGLYRMSKADVILALVTAARYRLTMNDAVKLYNKYIGNWGKGASAWRFLAVKNGEVVKTVVKASSANRHISLAADRTELKETHTYDVAAVYIRSVDENGNVLYFDNDPLKLSISGPFEIIGPDLVSLSGGQTGTYVKTTGKSGSGKLTVQTPEGDMCEIKFTSEITER